MNQERWRWFRFGLLSGLVRRGDPERLRDDLNRRPDEVNAVLCEATIGHSFSLPSSTRRFESDPARVIELLGDVSPDFKDAERVIHDLYEHARNLLADDRAADPEALFSGLRENVNSTEYGVPDLLRRVAACRRALGDFTGATEVLQLADEELASEIPYNMHALRSWTWNGDSSPRTLVTSVMCGSPDDAEHEAMTERMRRGAHDSRRRWFTTHRETAARITALACWLIANAIPTTSRHLELAESAMYSDRCSARAGLVSSHPLPSWSCSPRHADARA